MVQSPIAGQYSDILPQARKTLGSEIGVGLIVAVAVLSVITLAKRPSGWSVLVGLPAEILLSAVIPWGVALIPAAVTGLAAWFAADRIRSIYQAAR
jgi:hypothetical protein